MTDRELLEAAAKAAGIEIDFSHINGGGRFNTGFDAAGNAVLDWREYKTWNPLTDDGDAFRLGVQLSLFGHHRFTYHLGKAILEQEERDDCAAYRRGLTTLAAEIGKAMS